MANADESKSAEERRARLKALREQRTANAEDGEAPAAGDEDDRRARFQKAIARKRGLQGRGGGGRQRGAGGGAGRALGSDADGEQFPRLRKLLARRRTEGDDTDVAPEQQVEALEKRLQRLSEAMERTEAELAAARDSANAGAKDATPKARKKTVTRKVAAKTRQKTARSKKND